MRNQEHSEHQADMELLEHQVYCHFKRCLALMWGGHELSDKDNVFIYNVMDRLEQDWDYESVCSTLGSISYGEILWGKNVCDYIATAIHDVAIEIAANDNYPLK